MTTTERDQYYNCVVGMSEESATTLVWGDSHAQTLIWAINSIAERRGAAVRHVTKGGCPPIFYGVSASTKIDRRACIEMQKSAKEIVDSDPTIKTVFMAARWSLYHSADLVLAEGQANNAFDKTLVSTIRQLLALGLNVVVVDSLPEPGFDVANTLARQALIGQQSIDSFADGVLPFQSLKALVDVEDPHLQLMHLNSVLCSEGACPLWEQGELRYFDRDHLAKAGAQILTGHIERALFGNPPMKSGDQK